MNNIQIIENVNSVEKSLKQKIESFFLTVYPFNHLVSHGLEHHRRVWKYAKEILTDSEIQVDSDKMELVSNTIIACYFHDIGMAIDPGTRHGAHGRKICTEFLKRYNMSISEFKTALEAVEYHDDKDYPAHPEDNRVLDILSVADDLDAFGITGIFRYTEIYLKRGVSLRDIGSMILKNAESRFENLGKRIELSPEFKRKHSERYNYLLGFFRQYNKEFNSYNFSSSSPSGHCGIIQMLANNYINEYSDNPEKYSNDPFITNFFIQLQAENEHI
jgi:HD superfamily phosphodiesterase